MIFRLNFKVSVDILFVRFVKKFAPHEYEYSQQLRKQYRPK